MKFQVLVQRTPDDAGFISDVYAIDRNKFLVYEPDYAHFIWVDFDKHYFKGNDPAPYYFVSLWEEN